MQHNWRILNKNAHTIPQVVLLGYTFLEFEAKQRNCDAYLVQSICVHTAIINVTLHRTLISFVWGGSGKASPVLLDI